MALKHALMAAAMAMAAMPAAAQISLTAPKPNLAKPFTELDLFGMWAANCMAPASQANPYINWTGDRNGAVSRQLLMGPDMISQVATVTAAERVGVSQLRVVIGRDAGKADAVIEVKDKKWRVLSAHAPDGKVVAADGVYTGDRKPTAWLARCRS